MKNFPLSYKRQLFKHDFSAGLSVFFVALPLCLGIALASGAPLYAGLISGIIGGIIVASISGSSLAVSGPAAGLSTLVASTIIALGGFQTFLMAVIIAGLFQITLGLLKLGTISYYFPSSVIKGLLAAIGIILISKQIPIALGYTQPDFWSSGFLQLFSTDNWWANVFKLNEYISRGAIMLTLLCVILIILWKLLPVKITGIMPMPLVLVVSGMGFNMAFQIVNADNDLLNIALVNIPADVFSNILHPDIHSILQPQVWKYGITLGLLATIETLLCIEAIDKLDKQNRITPVNRELVAQGIGNIFCGILGAIPLTAVVVRGAANVDAGAKTKLAAIIHGFLLLMAVIFIPFLLNKIPYPSLAFILLITGYKLTTPKLYKNMWSLGIKQFLPFIITIIVILLADLLIGVGIGLLTAAYFIIQNNFKAEYKITQQDINGRNLYIIKLNSNVTFLNKVNLKKALDRIPENSSLVIDGSECNFIDYDIVEIISEFDQKANIKNIQLQLKGIQKVNVNAVH